MTVGRRSRAVSPKMFTPDRQSKFNQCQALSGDCCRRPRPDSANMFTPDSITGDKKIMPCSTVCCRSRAVSPNMYSHNRQSSQRKKMPQRRRSTIG